MKKIKKIMLTLLVMSFLANPMYLILRVHAANEEIAMSRISDTLQSVMQSSEEETIEVMIWLEDINTSQAVLSSTESILSAAKATLSPRALCENPETDSELFLQYMSERRKKQETIYKEYSLKTSKSLLNSNEIVYLSRYAPMIIADLSQNRIIEISENKIVASIDYYDDSTVKNNVESLNSLNTMVENNANIRGTDIPISGQIETFYSVAEIIDIFELDTLRTYVTGLGSGVKLGILDEVFVNLSIGYVDDHCTLLDGTYTGTFELNLIEHYSSVDYQNSYGRHINEVLEVLHSIVPRATFYYANCEHTLNNYTLCNEVEWLLDNDVQVICNVLNMRWDSNNSIYDEESTYGVFSKYFDYIINEYNVTYVSASGNDGTKVVNSAMSYNGIAVGNYDLGDNIIDEISSYYNGDLYAQKPDVCAPGYFLFNYGSTYDVGTSFAAPLVAAVAGLIICESEGVILHSTVKSIICASTDMHRYLLTDDNYKYYGAGIIDGWNIKQILTNGDYLNNSINPNAISTQHTIFLSSEESISADIVLTFACDANNNDIAYSIANLDIYLYDVNYELVACSEMTTGNVEILRDVDLYDDDYWLVIVQTEPASYNGSTIATQYSIAWCCK